MGENNQLENLNYEPISWWDEYSSNTSCDYDQFKEVSRIEEESKVAVSSKSSLSDDYSLKIAKILKKNLSPKKLEFIKELLSGASFLNCEEAIYSVKLIVNSIEKYLKNTDVDVELMEHYPVKITVHHQENKIILNDQIILSYL
jgi:hypothetical protein